MLYFIHLNIFAESIPIRTIGIDFVIEEYSLLLL